MCCCAVTFLPLWWSLPFLSANVVVGLCFIVPVLTRMMAHPHFAPGAQQLCAASCRVLLLVSGRDPDDASTAADGELRPPVCTELLTPRWLATMAVLCAGVVVPLYGTHLVLERHVQPCLWRLLRGQRAGVDVVEGMLTLVLLHVPALVVLLLSLAVWAMLLDGDGGNGCDGGGFGGSLAGTCEAAL